MGNDSVFSDALDRALVYTVDLHGAQRRNSAPGEPDGPSYLGHLLGVAALVIEDGGSEEEVIAALLHDSLEDTDATAADIEDRFGPEVVAIVVGCTDSEADPKPPWRERKIQYLEHLRSASGSVLLVSNADKLYNARTILRDLREVGDALWGRFTGGREGVLWYYGALSALFSDRHPGYLADELGRVVNEIEQLAV